MGDIQREIESELAPALRRLQASLFSREVEGETALALAAMALLAASGARERTTAPERAASPPLGNLDDAPRIINFERAKAALQARRALASVQRWQPPREPARPRLRIFRGD